ncbi:MAG: FtsW/RodA/SpoVE family cell cycle protein [Clostridiales bacterium]|jgi:rod shape determining protein RodA|nr:FtsW/RodA/SpoVE family cell cycle protein [Clostridiales bacterium]
MVGIRRNLRSFDIVLFVLVLLLSAFGLLMVGSTTGLGNGVVSATFISQLVFASTGVGIMLLAAFINFETICKFYLPIYGINIIFLVAVLFMPEQAGVHRWLGVEIGGTMLGVQPSEFAKIFMVIFLAKIIDKYKEKINHPLIIGLILASTALPVVLIFIQPSWSASIIPLAIMLAMLFVGRLSYKYIIVAVLIVIPAALFFFIELHSENPLILANLLEDYQIGRIWNFFYPELGTDGTFQNERAWAAFSSGLLTGRGLFNNEIAVPFASNDFIFAIIGAEFGFLGSLAVLVVILIIVARCFMIAHRSQVFLGKLIAVGVGVAIAFQSFVHVGVNTWILPNTGINLPFVSSGGSAIWVFMAMVGLVLNVGMTQEYSMFDDLGGGKGGR